MLPTFIGIGAPKAGTTWLAKCLDEHPEVFMAAVKEPYFFDYDTIEGRLEEYEVHFEGADETQAVGEISTRYLTSDVAPRRISRLLPDVRLFVSLRNPVDQVYSHYWHLKRQNFHQWDRTDIPETFEEALEAYPDLLVAPAFYYRHLTHWLDYFDRSQLHVILFDDIRTSPGQVIEDLYRHLSVDSSFRPEVLRERNASTRRGASPRGPVLERMRRFLYDVLTRKVYHPLKRTIGVKRATQIKDALQVRRLMETVFMEEGYPEMKPTTRRTLTDRFREDIRELEQVLERDLGHWREEGDPIEGNSAGSA